MVTKVDFENFSEIRLAKKFIGFAELRNILRNILLFPQIFAKFLKILGYEFREISERNLILQSSLDTNFGKYREGI